MSNEDVGAVTLVPPVIVDSSVVIARTVVLLVLLVLSLVGNSLIVLSVAQARSSRYFPFNAFILSMASFGLLECTLTMSLATGFSIEKEWKFGNFLAGFNASFVQLQNVGIILTILAMAIDRYIAVTKLTTYRTQPSVHKANYAVLYTWIHAFVFSLPLLFQNESLGITCRAFVERCLCGLEESTSVIFMSLTVGLCFGVPIFLIIIFLCLVKIKASREKRRVKMLSSADYAAYCLQESMLLKEAGLCGYVLFVFFLFFIFKLPYIIIDVLTQLRYQAVFEAVTSGSEVVVVDGSRFYYQTALSWMMFCFSAIFPYFTFVQFPDHWRNMKRYLTCAPVTTSVAGNFTSARDQRQLRQLQRRLRQRQKKARRNARNKKRASVSTLPQDLPQRPSTISNSITAEKITVNHLAAGGEVTFRVPVLYAATDGLHLVAPHKVLSAAAKHEIRTMALSSSRPKLANTSHNVSNSPNNSKIDQPCSDIIGDSRPSSVVDKRVDVTGSRDCLQSDDDVYVQSDLDSDQTDSDQTDSELNESANSRTLIWPKRRSQELKSTTGPPKSVWQAENHSNINEDLRNPHRSSQQRREVSFSEVNDPPHPHTPTPPPDEEQAQSAPHLYDNTSSINDHLMEKIRFSKLKLPALKGEGISHALSKRVSGLNRHERLINPPVGEGGLCNDGYESPSSSRCSDYSIVIRGTHPPRVFTHDYPDHDSRHNFVSSARNNIIVKSPVYDSPKFTSTTKNKLLPPHSGSLTLKQSSSSLPDIVPNLR